jgi:hypothetical protein
MNGGTFTFKGSVNMSAHLAANTPIKIEYFNNTNSDTVFIIGYEAFF